MVLITNILEKKIVAYPLIFFMFIIIRRILYYLSLIIFMLLFYNDCNDVLVIIIVDFLVIFGSQSCLFYQKDRFLLDIEILTLT